MTRVSVVMIFLDGARFIDEAITSVVDQTFGAWELLLVDDGSTDASTAIARSWAARDHRIRYLEHPGHANRGMSASRNLGIAAATGDLVAFLDCDDVWLPRHLGEQVEILDADPTLDATYDAYRLWCSWTPDPFAVADEHVARLGVEPDTVHEPGALLTTYRRDTGTLPGICSVLVRRAAVERIGAFEEQFRGCFEDQVFLAKLGLHLRVHVSGDCTSLYRRHPDSACATAIRAGTYHPRRPNAAERQYLTWLEGYLRDQGLDHGEVWGRVQDRLVVYRRPLSRPARAAFRERAHLSLRYRRRQLRRRAGRLLAPTGSRP